MTNPTDAEMIESINIFQYNGLLVILLYWLPLAFCAFGYLAKTYVNYQKDVAKREKPQGYYSPTDTIGTLIGRGLISIIPPANLLAAVFDLSPWVFKGFFSRLGYFFDIPLVPDSELYEAKRNEKKKP